MALEHGGHGGGAGIGITHVAANDVAGVGDVHAYDRCTFTRQSLDDGLADAARRARHERDLPPESIHGQDSTLTTWERWRARSRASPERRWGSVGHRPASSHARERASSSPISTRTAGARR